MTPLSERAQAEAHRVILLAAVQPELVQRRDHSLTRGESFHALKLLTTLVVHQTLLRQHVDELQVAALPAMKSLGSCAG